MSSNLRLQQTIAKPVTVRGSGYWTSLDVAVEFRPACADTGIVFVRRDAPGCPRISAHVAHRVDVPRRTSLSGAGYTVDMVEHILAALSGLRIDNCEVHVDRAEMPGCDGSSSPFVQALLGAGIRRLDQPRLKLVVTKPMRIGDNTAWIRAEPARGGFFLRYELDYPAHPQIGRQTIELEVTVDSFCDHLAPARTFLVQEEADWMRQQGLGRRVSYQDLLVFGERGPIDNTLRFSDECVRHKALDVVGDFALAPFDLVGRFTAHRSGHRLNAEMVKRMLHECEIVCGLRKSAA